MSPVEIQREIRVLRLGLVRDGKIVQDRRIRRGDPVTVGSSARATLQCSLPNLPVCFPIFLPRGDGYALQFNAAMSGKLASGNRLLTLDELRDEGLARKRGEAWFLPIGDQDRGKLVLDEHTTLLFQFVTAPPEPLHPVLSPSFKPRFMDRDDPLFMGLLGFFSLMASLLVTWTINTEVVQVVTIDELGDVIAWLPPVPMIVEEGDNRVALLVPEEPVPPPRAVEPAPEPISPTDELARRERDRQEVMDAPLIKLLVIGTTGRTRGTGVIEDLVSRAGPGREMNLDGIGGADVATRDTLGYRTSTLGSTKEDETLGERSIYKVGSSTVKVDTRTDLPQPKIGTDDPVIPPGARSVQGVVTGKSGVVKACYERYLKDSPELAGRVELHWTIANGRATGVSVVGNSTGSASLAECIRQAASTWRFEGITEPTEIYYPFVLSKG